MGHWAKGSRVPLQYDQARCCTELLVKARVRDAMKDGFVAAGTFEMPAFREMGTLQQEDPAPPPEPAASAGADQAVGHTPLDPHDFKEDLFWIWNNSSKILHRGHAILAQAVWAQALCTCSRSAVDFAF